MLQIHEAREFFRCDCQTTKGKLRLRQHFGNYKFPAPIRMDEVFIMHELYELCSELIRSNSGRILDLLQYLR